MNGRFFSTRAIQAYVSTGTERFKKTNEKKVGLFDVDGEDDGDETMGKAGGARAGAVAATGDGDDEGRRLDQFGNWLEGNG